MTTLFRASVLIAGVFIGAAVVGCGGGGSTPGGFSGGSPGNPVVSPNVVVLGRVVGPDGNPVPGATVVGGGAQDVTLSQGSFRLANVAPGTVRISASSNSNNTQYTGSTQVVVLDQRTTSNVTIVVSPPAQQAKVAGVVRDTGGNPIRDARVFLGIDATPPPSTGTGDVSSLVAITDSQGRYELDNIPTGVVQYTVAASLLGFQNTFATVNNLAAGEKRSVDLTMSQSVGNTVPAPTGLSLQSFTQPTAATAHIVGARRLDSSGVYNLIRKTLNPNFERLWNARHLSKSIKHLTARVRPSAILDDVSEIDAFFSESNIDAVAGYRIYEADPNQQLQPWDFLQDPLANFYSDPDTYYVPDTTYTFAVSAISNDNQESGLSNQASVTPLEAIRSTIPGAGSQHTNPVTFTWTPVNGVQTYALFVYNQFPGAEVQPLIVSSNLSPNNTAYTLSQSLASGDYWFVVAASADSGTAISVSQIVQFHVN